MNESGMFYVLILRETTRRAKKPNNKEKKIAIGHDGHNESITDRRGIFVPYQGTNQDE